MLSHFKKLDILEQYKRVADDIIDSGRIQEVVDAYFSTKHTDKSFICHHDTFKTSHKETEAMIKRQRKLYDSLTEMDTVQYIESRIMSSNDLHPIRYTSHASFNFNTNRGKYNLNHYKFYIFLKENYGYTDEYVLGRENVQFSFKKLWQYAMCLWYQRNMLEGKEMWPGSCTGFTDFLFYCIVSQKTCLTISKTLIKDSVCQLKYYKKIDEVVEKEI